MYFAPLKNVGKSFDKKGKTHENALIPTGISGKTDFLVLAYSLSCQVSVSQWLRQRNPDSLYRIL